MAEYLGAAPFVGLSRHQVLAIEANATCSLPDASWHNGFWRLLFAELGPAQSYSHAEVLDGIDAVFANLGLTSQRSLLTEE